MSLAPAQALEVEASDTLLPDFGATAGGLVDGCLSGYDAEAMYFHATVRADKRAKLAAALMAKAEGVYRRQLALLTQQSVAAFRQQLKQGLGEWPRRFAQCAAECRDAAEEQFSAAAARLVVPGADWPLAPEVQQLLVSGIAHIV